MRLNTINPIKRARTLKGIRQEQVARDLGMAVSTYARIENGALPLSFDRAERLSEILDTTVVRLFSMDVNTQATKITELEKEVNRLNTELTNTQRKYITLLEKLNQ